MLEDLTFYFSRGYIEKNDETSLGFDCRFHNGVLKGYEPQWKRDLFALTGCSAAGKYIQLDKILVYCEEEISQISENGYVIKVKAPLPNDASLNSRFAIFSCIDISKPNARLRFLGVYSCQVSNSNHEYTSFDIINNRLNLSDLESYKERQFKHHFSFEMIFEDKNQLVHSFYAIKTEVIRSFSIMECDVSLGFAKVDGSYGLTRTPETISSSTLPNRFNFNIKLSSSINRNEFVTNIQAICKRIQEIEESNHGNLDLRPRFLILDSNLQNNIIDISSVYEGCSDKNKQTKLIIENWYKEITE